MDREDFAQCGAQVLEKIRAIAMADVTDLVTVTDGELQVLSTDGLTPDQKAAIASIERSAGGLRVKFYDKLKALELLGKCLGLFDGAPLPTGQQDTLLREIRESTREVMDTDDLPEVQ